MEHWHLFFKWPTVHNLIYIYHLNHCKLYILEKIQTNMMHVLHIDLISKNLVWNDQKYFEKKIPGIMIVITWEVVEHKNLSNKNKVYPKAICHRIKTIIFLHLTMTPLHTIYIIPHLKIWKRLKSLNDRAAYSWGVFFSWSNKAMSDTHLQASFLMSPNLKSFIPKQGIQVLLHRQNKTFPVPGYFTSLFDVHLIFSL